MRRYYFHIHNDADTLDEEGTVLPSPEAARERAAHEARNLAAESVKLHGHLVLNHYVTVTDELGEVLDTLEFGDVVEIRREG